jgi:hypothetical protein
MRHLGSMRDHGFESSGCDRRRRRSRTTGPLLWAEPHPGSACRHRAAPTLFVCPRSRRTTGSSCSTSLCSPTSSETTGPASSGDAETRAFAELLIDCKEDRTLQAVLVGMLREAERSGPS